MSDENENDLIAQRRQQLQELRESGNAFRNDFKRDSLAADLIDKFGEKTKEERRIQSKTVSFSFFVAFRLCFFTERFRREMFRRRR